jgi:Tol biopolymer transport system component
MKVHALLAAALAVPMLAVPVRAGAQTPRSLRPDDVFALKDVDDPRVSPDGKWVAYTVTTLDAKEDESDTDIYMAPLAGGDAVRLTSSKKSESKPRWSPDGRWLAFLSAREGKKTQVWLMSRAGGEAVKLTDYKASVSDLVWSPDSARLALVVSDVDPDDPDLADDGKDAEDAKDEKKKKTPKPIVVRRLQFKRDTEGYLRDVRAHIHVFELATKKTVQVTSGPYDDASPAWSPDGQSIAFVSTRAGEDPDAGRNTDIFVVAPRAGESPRAVVSAPGADGAPAFSPDGKWIAYVAGGDPKDIWYATTHLAIAPAAGGASDLRSG